MGCKTSKDISQPGKLGDKNKSPTKAQAKRNHTPSKSPSKPIKEVDAAALAKSKESDIIGYVKTGNLPMVHALIRHFNLGIGAMNIKASGYVVAASETHPQIAGEWNPLLIAIEEQKLDIV
jgi:hypothetical protein